MAGTYERQKLWNEYRRSKITRKSSERDEKDAEELTFAPRTNRAYNRNVKSRLLDSTASLRNANIHRSTRNAHSTAAAFSSSASAATSSYTAHAARRRAGSKGANATVASSRRRGAKSSSTARRVRLERQAPQGGGDEESERQQEGQQRQRPEPDAASSTVGASAAQDDLLDDNPDNDSVVYTDSVGLGSDDGGGDADDGGNDDDVLYDDGPEGPSKIIGERHSSTGISLHVARQRKARMRKQELRSGKAFKTKRAALHAKPFTLSSTNLGSSKTASNGGPRGGPGDTLNLSAVSAVSFGVHSHHHLPAGGVMPNDVDVQHLAHAHRREMREAHQDHATELKRVSDDARQSQEDALIRQEVALRRLFDGERRAWQEEKGQLMMLIGSLQKEIAERSEARAHAETMARKMTHVVGSLEKRLLQVEQGAQDEIRKLRAALMMGGGGAAAGMAAPALASGIRNKAGGPSSGSYSGSSVGGGAGGQGGFGKAALRSLSSEMASGVRKLMRAHESNMRSLFAGREESAMRQTEGLRVHIESTVEQSEERMSALVENGVAGSGGTFEAGSVAEARLRELGNKMARLMEMVTGLQGGQEVVGAAPGLNETTDATKDEAVPDAPSVPLSVQTVRGRRSSSAADVAVPLRPVHAMGIVDSAGVSKEGTPAGNGDGGVEAGEADRQEEASASAQDKVQKLAPDMKDSDGQNEEGAGDIGQVARVMYIRVPNPDGGFFFFDTATQQLYEGDGEPPADQILEEPTLDSPLRLPPREGGF